MRLTAITITCTLAAAGLFVAGPAPAAGAPVNLSGPGFTVQFSQAPFAMQVLNSTGRTVLAQVPHTGGPSLAADVSTLPLGVNPSGVPFTHRYAPFTFTVGPTSTIAFPATPWVGDLLAAANAGVQYAAAGVQSAHSVPGGLELTLTTDDPSGRTLAVTLTTDSGRLRVAVIPSSTTGIVAMGDSFISRAGEELGGRRRYRHRSAAAGHRSSPAPGASTICSPAVRRPPTTFSRSSSRRPATVSCWASPTSPTGTWTPTAATRGWSTSPPITSTTRSRSVMPAGDQRTVGGRRSPPRPPAWALGAQLDRRINSGQSGDSYAATVHTDLATIVADNLPVTAYRIEAWLTIFRVHGAFTGTHMPWDFDQQTLDTYRQLATLHQRAAPLINTAWASAASTGIPLMRPVWLAAPTDARAWAADQEWMLGPDVLVAPVVTRGGTQRTVYIPPGCWNRQDSTATYNGPSETTVAAPLTDLPYFFRCASTAF